MGIQAVSLENLITENETLRSENEQLRQQNQWLLEQFRLARQRRFGASSEQTGAGQVSFFNETGEDTNSATPEINVSKIKAHTRKRTRLTTDKLPEGLPVEIVEHELPADRRVCPDCGGELHVMGKETAREELKVIQPKIMIVRHVRDVYACRCCEATADHVPIVKADVPTPVIKGGFAAPETVAHIAAQKFMMGIPLNRQEMEWKQNGVCLSRQTMSNWLIKASEDWLEPIYEEMKHRLCRHTVAHADESVLQVLKEPGKPAQSKSYMWLYRTSGEAKHPIVLYDYQPDRRHMHPEAFLKNFTGYLHTDGYDGYHNLPENIIVVGCMAHLRRKFVDAQKVLPKDKQQGSLAAKGVGYCDKLFHLEKLFPLLSPEKRYEGRSRLSKPILEELYNWIQSVTALPNTHLGKAVHYAKSQRKYLERYLLDGRLEISNNRAERSIRSYVTGRKNWIFCKTPGGARACAVYYSMVVTARENGLNPFEYLSWIFRNAPNLGKPGYVAAVEDFLPGSPAIPEEVFTPMPVEVTVDRYAWEEA